MKLDLVTAALTGFLTVVDGAEHLLSVLHDDLTTAIANDDMSQVQAIVDTINAKKSELASAIAANTPADTPGGDVGGDTLTGSAGDDSVSGTDGPPPPTAN